jgi:polysaccharide export outer membrane protein
MRSLDCSSIAAPGKAPMRTRRLVRRRLSACLVILHALWFSPAFAEARQSAPLQQSASPQSGQYIVGPNDVLAIVVVDQPQLAGKYIVRADGTFTFPLLGRLQAGGLSVQAVENDVRDRLAKGYLKDPQVGVSVDQFRSQQIFVMGEVRTPGTLQFTGPMTLIEALARAGATTEHAGTDVVIVRPLSGAPPVDATAIQQRVESSKDADLMRVDLQKLQAGALSLNLALRSGDTIFVPRAESVFVSGQVVSAGEYGIRKGMTIRQAIALAGGVTERGSTRRIQIVRQVDGSEVTVGASLQDTVRPGDTIVVRERLF